MKRGKRSQLPAPRAGEVARWKEPTKAELGLLRQWLSEHRDKPLPRPLQDNLWAVLYWAAWQIGRPWDRERKQYQRWCAVCEGIEDGSKFEDALAYAVKKLAPEPSRGGIGVMKKDYQTEQRMHGLSRRPRRSPSGLG